jgi:hypothetical protein
MSMAGMEKRKVMKIATEFAMAAILGVRKSSLLGLGRGPYLVMDILVVIGLELLCSR